MSSGILGSLLDRQLSWSAIALSIVGVYTLYNITHWFCALVYNLFFHPLRNFPGPKLWIAFPILRHVALVRGKLDFKVKEFHDVYGDVIRFADNDLSFTTSQAWLDIYSHGHAELPKYFPPAVGYNGQNVLSAKGPDHFRMRRAIKPAFSDRALGMQEPLIRVYVDLLNQRLREIAVSEKPTTDIVWWYTLATFDLIGDLAYGESFQGLAEQKTNPWLDSISGISKLAPVMLLSTVFPLVGAVLQFMTKRQVRESKEKHYQYSRDLALRRINRDKTDQKDRGDFMDAMLRSRGEPHELTDEELVSNADLMIIAGSETTLTLLAAVTYFVLKTPHALERATKEVRSAYAKVEDIDFKSASKLPYMLACLNEALRIFPPVPFSFQRVTLPGAPTPISGMLVPENTRVGVHHFSAYHSAKNFYQPESFHPERWLPDAKTNPRSPFFNDNRESHKPFSAGPRDCIGRNLAYHEMRLVLATILFNFDLKLDGPETWENQKAMGLWEKPPLMVQIKLRDDSL